MSSDDRRSAQDRPFVFSGIGTFPRFSCHACGQWSETGGRRMLAYPGVLRKQWTCKACVKARAQ